MLSVHTAPSIGNTPKLTWPSVSNEAELSGEVMFAMLAVGSRVVRGRDWPGGEEDGPPPAEGSVMTVRSYGIMLCTVLIARSAKHAGRKEP